MFTGLTHYKQKSRIIGSQSRLRVSKPHNNALHAFCSIETIELPLRSSHKKSVFEPRPAPSRKHYGKAFIMRKPCSCFSFFLPGIKFHTTIEMLYYFKELFIMNNFIFLGPPGAGKGSLAVKVAADYKIPHISTGDIFRANIKAQTPLGVKVKAIIDSGSLVSDELTFELVKDRLAQDDCKNGYILDGFPRTIPQAEMLEGLVSDVKVVNFEIKDEIVIKRLSTRRVCKACGANYNVLTLKPKVEGICDKCGGELYQRDDDKQESILHRMDVYREQTEPLINFYKEKGKITDLDASIETDILLGKFKEIFK